MEFKDYFICLKNFSCLLFFETHVGPNAETSCLTLNNCFKNCLKFRLNETSQISDHNNNNAKKIVILTLRVGTSVIVSFNNSLTAIGKLEADFLQDFLDSGTS